MNAVSAATEPVRARALALPVARWAALVAIVGIAISPPLVNLAAAIMLCAFAASPDAGARLRRVWREPFGRAIAILLGVLALAALFSTAPLPHALAALWGWRPLLFASSRSLCSTTRASSALSLPCWSPSPCWPCWC